MFYKSSKMKWKKKLKQCAPKMGITKQYLRYIPSGTCNIIGSTNGAVAAINDVVCAVSACESVNFYNVRTCEKTIELSESEKSVTALKFSSNRRFLAVGYADGVVRLYDRKSEGGEAYVTFAGHKTGVNCLAFSPDGLILASGGKVIRQRQPDQLTTHLPNDKDASKVYTFALVKGDRLLLLGTAEIEIRVIELTWLGTEQADEAESNTEDLKRVKKENQDDVAAVDDQANKVVRCKKRGQLLRQSKGRALQMAVSSDERIVACVGASDLVDIYRIYSDDESLKRISKKLRKAKKKAAASGDAESPVCEAEIAKDVTILISRIGDYRSDVKVKWVDFSPFVRRTVEQRNEYRIFVLQTNNTVHCITTAVDFKSNEVECTTLATLDQLGHRTDVRSLAMAESDFGFVSGSAEAAIVWNRYSLKVANVLEDEKMKDVTAVLFVTGDKHVLTATKGGNVFLFELSTNESLEMKKGHEAAIWRLVSTPDKKGFISCGADKKIIYWTYELVSEFDRKRLSIRERRVLELPDEALCVAASPDSRFVGAGLLDNTARLHFVDTFKLKRLSIRERRVLELPDEALCVAASPDSRFVGAGLLDNTARLHFVDTFKLFVTLYGHSLPVTCIDMSHDSKIVVTGSADKSVKIWGLDFGDCHKSLHAHDDIVTCVQFVPKEHMFWSAGKDGLLKQWDGDKFERIQVLGLHSAEIRAIAQTSSGNFIVSASHDKSIRLWELTEEIIVLQEEEEMEREKEYEKRLADFEDVVPGEEKDAEVELAPRKSIMSIKSAEQIIEAVEIVRSETVARIEDPKHSPHPLVTALQSASLDHFILDVIQRVPSSHLEKSLLMVPFSFVPDILRALGECASRHYKAELSCRVLLFLVKIHHNHIINSEDMVQVIDGLRQSVPRGIIELRDICGFNMAALRLFQKEIEERNQVKMFADVSEVEQKAKKKIRKAVLKTFT
ncbi:WD repeat-containing protein 3 [Toxocara canis]|uniref:WD repeat-containing protein 3 n=1 Tax=Toxocara canis TaxID=6265 RepID=A0A0B2VRY8_TOXCA|nr:WD repeat-containing protein 3 [Toxocara canis]